LYFELVHASFVWGKFAIGQIFSRRNLRFPGQYLSTSVLDSSLFSKITLSEQSVRTWVPRNKAVRLRKSGSIRLKSAVTFFVVQWVKRPGTFGEDQNYILSSPSLFFPFLRALFSVAFNNSVELWLYKSSSSTFI
jgi:hypothetical protein